MLCDALAKVPSQTERNEILECHTMLRENVKPTASNMQFLSYSVEMEKLADEFVNKCSPVFPGSDPRYKNLGYIQLPFTTTEQQYKEALCTVNGSSYIYENESCPDDCLAYVQMVWAESTEVGCAKHHCNLLKNSTRIYYMMACIYKPGDPKLQTKPYIEGPSCSNCTRGYGCYRNQCRANYTTTTTSGSSAIALFPVLLLSALIFNCLH
uniref:SCP domain-containing protein n=2 Tax=Mesocestoides corti TaxID=53468 RepID=A0A5K3FCG4_MESCO